MVRMIFIAAMVCLLLGCSREKTEEERLEDAISSLGNKTYRVASEKGVKTVAAQVNKASPGAASPTAIHAVLGILWHMKEKPERCYIEADILDNPNDVQAHGIALALKMLALREMELPRLTTEHYESLKTLIADQSGATPEEVDLDNKLFLISLILVGLGHGDPELAQFGADALGAVAEVDYLPPLVGFIAETRKGNVLRARKELRELCGNEEFRARTRALFQEVSDEMELSDEPEQSSDALVRAVTDRLARQLLDDIFTSENKELLLRRAQKLQEMLAGNRQSEELPPETEEGVTEPISEVESEDANLETNEAGTESSDHPAALPLPANL